MGGTGAGGVGNRSRSRGKHGGDLWSEPSGPHVPLGQIADIRIVTGPPMIRDEAGMLVGYVYVDMDAAKRDIGGYVDDADRRWPGESRLPPGYSLKWTGQYELLQQMQARMKFVVPLTLVIVPCCST